MFAHKLICTQEKHLSKRYLICISFSTPNGRCSEIKQSFPLPQVQLLLHWHQQGCGAPAAAPENGLYQCSWLWQVHPDTTVPDQRMWSQWETNPLPLRKVSICSLGSVTDGGAQISACQWERMKSLLTLAAGIRTQNRWLWAPMLRLVHEKIWRKINKNMWEMKQDKKSIFDCVKECVPVSKSRQTMLHVCVNALE